MNSAQLCHRANRQAESADFLFVEGVMGLFDGAAGGAGSTANLAKLLGLPILLVLDVKGQAQTAAALAMGLKSFDPDIHIGGVLLNRVGSEVHETLLREAFDAVGLSVVGAVRHSDKLSLPSRHLGLVQAEETEALDDLIDQIAEHMLPNIDLDMLLGLMGPMNEPHVGKGSRLSPLGQHVAIACDDAFSFIYPHLLDDWNEQGASISFFSPLNDETPSPEADSIYLPGGYPELHLDKLVAASRFREDMKLAAQRGCLIYGRMRWLHGSG